MSLTSILCVKKISLCLGVCLAVCGIEIASVSVVAATEYRVWQDEKPEPDEVGKDVDEAQGKEGTKDDKEPAPRKKKPKVPVDPQMIRVELWDGSTISGKIQLKVIKIETEFGMLEVPVGRIRRILPGIRSYPQLKEEISKLVEQLGDKDFDVREAAQRQLIDKGVMFNTMLSGFDDGGSAERKKRLAEVLKELDSYREMMEEELEDTPERDLAEGDTIETEAFSIVGKIKLENIAIKTKFGDLAVTLSDIKGGDRTAFQKGETVNRNFSVKGDAFFQRKPVLTAIRVERGDRITIRASGIVNWTNWNTISSPEGLTNQGQYKGIPCGALVARIGKSGKMIKIGSKHSFVAPGSGMLYLGVAMQDNYVNEASYRWTGNFKTKVRVEQVE